eukprot:TRINITY_DN1757_c0_g1_i10.p1 TRINITY_DN1757_c0_g1~~TRINITY_DN1757_c0_g1_i10.p1  ORF type:complete len:547 (-),score=65.60 TRINITY_DN1757_c0_g1_i10:117-1586(-)
MASFAAARSNLSVLLFDNLGHIGGMVTGGLSHTDIGESSVIGGSTLRFFKRVGSYYNNSGPQWYFEPHVALATFNELLEEKQNYITVWTNTDLQAVNKVGTKITSISVQRSSTTLTVSAKAFIDSSYTGDLMALAGVSTTWGREGISEYQETLAGRRSVPSAEGNHQFVFAVDPYDAPGELSPLVYGGDPGRVGDGDKKVQSYNFHLCFTTNKSNRVPFPQPTNYDPSYWGFLKRYLDQGVSSITSLLTLGPLPNDKYDVNNNGPISTNAIGMSWNFPPSNWTERMNIWQQHIDYTQGFFYFLANDPSVPKSIHYELNERYGICADEFTDTNNWPPMLHIRECLRMLGSYIFTQFDREVLLRKVDTIGMGSYNIDVHNSQRFPQGTGTVTEGDVERKYRENFEIPYRTLLPKSTECSNLLVTVCVSASHAGYGALRLEPQYMIMGEAAGEAAAQAVLLNGGNVSAIDVTLLQATLTSQSQVLSQNDWAY